MTGPHEGRPETREEVFEDLREHMAQRMDNLPVKVDVTAVAVPVVDHNTGEIVPAARDAGPPMGSVEGIATLELTDAQQAILSAPPNEEHDVTIRADGVLYACHAKVRQRLNRAVGIGRWALRQEGLGCGYNASEEICFWDGSLWVNGKYASRAVGQCKWKPTNRKMSRYDALEGAKSDCLSRCSKELGVFLELWDPEYRGPWKKKYAETYVGENGDILWRKRGSTEPAPEDDISPPVRRAAPTTAPGKPLPPVPPLQCRTCGSKLLDHRRQHEADAVDKARLDQGIKPRPAMPCPKKGCKGGSLWKMKDVDEAVGAWQATQAAFAENENQDAEADAAFNGPREAGEEG